MTKIKIEKDAPLPVHERGSWIATMRAMKHGESILLGDRKEADRFFQAARNLEGYGITRKFTSRAQENNKIRIWAIDLPLDS